MKKKIHNQQHQTIETRVILIISKIINYTNQIKNFQKKLIELKKYENTKETKGKQDKAKKSNKQQKK